MSKILAVVFGLIACSVALGMDFYLQMQKHDGQAFGVMDYVALRSAGAIAAEMAVAEPVPDAAATEANVVAEAAAAKPALPAVVSLAKGGTAPTGSGAACVRRAGKLVCPKK